jgi:mono/diheme cytochrome c family protein
MQLLSNQLVLANTQRTIGLVLAALLAVAFVTYVLITMRIGRREAGAEVELAPNRKPYLDDEELETRKLDQSLVAGLVLLLAVGIGLPAYWLAEPGRQDGEKEHQLDQYLRRGEHVYTTKAQCINCHAAKGAGGTYKATITDAEGNFVDQVNWAAPALDTVMYRYSREEIRQILTYGRPGTPMPAWGIAGGGPLDAKSIEDVITYLEYLQKPVEKVRAEVAASLDEVCGPEEVAADSYTDPIGDGDGERDLINPACTAPDAQFETMGEALFNLPAAGGTYSCARCHTRYSSTSSLLDEPPEETARGLDGGGWYGPSLRTGATSKYTPAEHLEFVTTGGVFPGTWEMPGFGFNPNAEDEDSVMEPEQFMLTAAQIEAIVAYERSL